MGFKVASDSSEGLAKTYLVVVCEAGSVLMIRRVRGFFGGAGGGAVGAVRRDTDGGSGERLLSSQEVAQSVLQTIRGWSDGRSNRLIELEQRGLKILSEEILGVLNRFCRMTLEARLREGIRPGLDITHAFFEGRCYSGGNVPDYFRWDQEIENVKRLQTAWFDGLLPSCKDTPVRGRVLPYFVAQLNLTQQTYFNDVQQKALLDPKFNPPAGGGGPRPPVSEVLPLPASGYDVLQFFNQQIPHFWLLLISRNRMRLTVWI